MPQADDRTDPLEIAISDVQPHAIPEAVVAMAALAREAQPGYPSSSQAIWAAATGQGDPDGRG